GNELDCCVKLPLLDDLSLSFVPGIPVGTFNTTGIRNGFGGVGQGGLNKFFYTAPQFYDDLSWTRGRHSIRTGFAFERVLDNLEERHRPNGLWHFPPTPAMLQVQPTKFSAQFPARMASAACGTRFLEDTFRTTTASVLISPSISVCGMTWPP